MLAKDTLLDNRYRIVELLGTGAMGSVYLALDERLSCNVAVKGTIIKNFRLEEAATLELRRAFEREAKLLANLQHEAIPHVSDYFAFEGEQYLVMEYISGSDLYEQTIKRRESGKPFPTETVVEWALQLLDALHYLHTQPQPVIHKDIKLSNLKTSRTGKIKLLDFGIAKGFAGEMTRVDAGSLQMGTEDYAPLEQFLKFPSKAAETLRQALSIKHAEKVEYFVTQQTEPRSDLYSLAVTMYRLLGGKSPADYLPRALAVWEGEPDPLAPLHELNRDVPVEVSNVLMSALALDKKERPASAMAMHADLEEAWHSVQNAEVLRKREQTDREIEGARTELERRLSEETARYRAELTGKNHEIKELTNRLQRFQEGQSAAVGAGQSFEQPRVVTDNAPTKVSSAQVKPVDDAPTQVRRSTPINNSILSKILGRKYLVLIGISLALVSGIAFTWGISEQSRQTAEQEKRRLFDEHFGKGNVALKNRDLQTAAAEFTRAIEIDPAASQASDVYANRGEAYRRQQDYERAIADYSEAVRIKPENAFALTNRADVRCQQKDFERAYADFDEALRRRPNYDFAFEKRGYCYENQGKLDEALSDYNQAVNVDPNDPFSRFRRGQIFALRGDLENTLLDFNKVVELTPNDPTVYTNRGRVYEALGRNDLAAADFKRAKELGGNADGARQ